MTRQLLALARPRVHHDALDWARRVVTNSGSVSQSTLRAVSAFCDAIDRAGIRDKFYRLNLFCGTGLNACLVPLYRGKSLTGTQYGNATDTNSNFVNGDYVETGSTGGLLGNGTSKTLDTGIAGNSVTFGNLHLAAYVVTAPSSGTYRPLVTSRAASNADEAALYSNQAQNSSPAYFSEENTVTGYVQGTTNNPNGLLLGTSVSSTDRRFYRNGSQQGSTVTNALTRTQYPTSTHRVFYQAFAGLYSSVRMAGYSVGNGLTSTQVTAYYNAMQALQTALGRNV